MITILKQMQTKLDNIVKTVLARPSLQSVDKEELLMLTHEFPYAPILQFLYTKRLQQSQDPRFGDSVTKTALFFNNPHWLYQQLRDNTPAELLKAMEEKTLPSSNVPSPDVIYPETSEDEEIDVYHLTPSEQALIASITEAPDGSLMKDTAASLAEETTENESGYETFLDLQPGEDDGSAEVSLEPEMDEEVELDDAKDHVAESDLEEYEYRSTSVIESETDDLTAEPIPSNLSETDDDADGPTPEAVVLSELAEASSTETLLSESVVSSEEGHRVLSDSEPDIIAETIITATPAISSLITVISSVGTFEDHPIHTIGVEKSSVRDDESTTLATETTLPDAKVSEAVSDVVHHLEEPAVDFEFESEADNDDDSATMLSETVPEDSIKSHIASDHFEVAESFPSGLENMGFLPETLLEESDATETESEEEYKADYTTTREGWDAFQLIPEKTDEGDDHPDATDPGENYGYDQDGPSINPGDFIKMAGLDQHHETELSFEPLHLTDYFASVGVSLPPEEQPDVFGRQSRSFTGWIKSMKRIHPEKNSVVAPFTQTESDLMRVDAEQSNEQEEVLTETMANIYALQGMTNKAIDIYEKLSLLNPEKSAIFAAKLSELKGKLP